MGDSIEEIVHGIIHLANEAEAERDRLDHGFKHRDGDPSAMRRFLEAPRPAQDAWARSLLALPDGLLFKLHTLMKFGRADHPSLWSLHATRRPRQRDKVIASMIIVPAAGTYLAVALELAREQGIDLDGDWGS